MHTPEEPILEIVSQRARLTLLGTAHVSRASADQVEAMLDDPTRPYDAVAVELCPSRYNAIMRPDDLARMDLFAVIREGRVYMVAASLALAAYQQRLADQFGIEPGAEQRVAIRLAQAQGLPVLLIDREVGVTLRRAARNLGWWKRFGLFSGLLASLLSRERISEDEIERLKQGDVLETTFGEFAEDRGDLYVPLIDERDRYMAARLQQEIADNDYRHILAVVGAGHLKGLAANLAPTPDSDPEAIPDAIPAAIPAAIPTAPAATTGHQVQAAAHATPAEVIAELERVPPPSPVGRLLPWLIVALILGLFAYGFTQSSTLGWNLVLDWVLINGGLAALGALLAGAHPATVLTAFCAAPFTSLNPTIGAGTVTAGVELFLRRPSVGDFGHLRDAITSVRGWWQNRVTRILLVFIFSTIGSAIGTYLAGFRIVGRLVG